MIIHKLIKAIARADNGSTLKFSAALGIFPVLTPPRYQLPMSVNFPCAVSMAALGPTFDLSLRNDPK